ncbi:hypothetical protein BH11PSE8_BH11PSE8_43650 [soil metagenome]
MTDFHIPPEFDFGQQFDRATLTRAMALDPERAVLAMRVEGPALFSRLRGSSAHAYEQRTELPIDRRLGLQVRGKCTCPVGNNCKHVAAALMAFEAFQIKLRKDPTASNPLAPVNGAAVEHGAPWPQTGQPRVQTLQQRPGELPRQLIAWLAELAEAALLPDPPPAVTTEPKPPAARQLMYVLSPQGTQLVLTLYLGTLRKTGEIGAHRLHTAPVTDMLRNQPAYLTEADQPVLAALLPLTTTSFAGASPLAAAASPAQGILRGRGAMAALRAVLGTGRAWLVPSAQATLPTPPGSPAAWSDEPLTVTLQWHADAMGQWRTQWRGAADTPLHLIQLPEPLAFDLASATVRPAQAGGAPLSVAVTEWLGRMPAVPGDLLPQFVERLQTVSTARQLALPLPEQHARQVQDFGLLKLVPVLRLTSCIDVASEALLHESYGPVHTRGMRLRQAAAQLLLRYQPPSGAPIEFHFPAGAADTAFIESPGQRMLVRFERDAKAESAALIEIFTTLECRPWSLVAGLALDRLARLGQLRVQSSVIPAALEGKPLIVVPQRRDQWPTLLAQGFPALEAQGWKIEVEDDFPFEMHQADEWAVSIDEEPAGDWFSVGLKVVVEGRPVNLVPLLVGLVQTGWLSLDAAVRSAETAEEQDTPAPDTPADVLLPWPSDSPLVPGQTPRQRLLRLPVARIAPLMDWLRGVFRAGDKRAPLRISRFDVGTLEALSEGAKVTAPPSFTELVEQIRALRLGEGLPAVEPSSNVRAVLRHYQLDGLAWMDFMRRARLGGVLADDMGLGKTLQALALLQAELDAGRLDRPSLVIVPTTLLGNWHDEAARFTPGLELLLLHGPRRTQDFDRIAHAHVVITSYPLAVRDIETLRSQPWHYLVLDEAQRIKNSRSQAAIALKGLRARHRLCLSGTPLENHLGELWSLMDFVCPGLLGSEAQFREHYRNPIEKRQDTLQAQTLARRVRPFILRRTKQQVARELPEKTETLLRVELTGAQADLYETVRATMDQKLRDGIARQGLARSQIMVLDALLKLRQVCNDPRLLKVGEGASQAAAKAAPSAKMELLLDLLPTLIEDGRRVLLFSQFTEMLALIEPELVKLKLPYLKLTGETRDRSEVVAAFQQGEVPLFLISLKAGGVGLNLTAADTVILFDPWWNPAVEQQAIDRAYRIGQDKPVFVYKLLASGTVEDKILDMQARKAGLADLLLSGVASDAALNAQDFDELFEPLTKESAND